MFRLVMISIMMILLHVPYTHSLIFFRKLFYLSSFISIAGKGEDGSNEIHFFGSKYNDVRCPWSHYIKRFPDFGLLKIIRSENLRSGRDINIDNEGNNKISYNIRNNKKSSDISDNKDNDNNNDN